MLFQAERLAVKCEKKTCLFRLEKAYFYPIIFSYLQAMNKFLLLGAASILSIGAHAQHAQRTVSPFTQKGALAAPQAPAHAQTFDRTVYGTLPIAAKTAAAAFWTEDFSSGTPTSLPSGWTAVGNSSFPATWKWANAASGTQFSIGAIQSTTASNGWMIYDSDSIGSLNATATPQEGWLTSPAINCSGKSSVVLTFEQRYRRFNDSCFVEVSTNNFATYTTYDVLPNINLTNNDYSGPNPPTPTRINISATAANQPNVQFRFYYKGTEPGGSYSWMVDDVALSEADPIDVNIHSSSLVMRGKNRYTLASSYPVSLVDSTWGITCADNDGATAVTPDFTYNVTRGGAAVYNYSRQIALPIASMDSLIDFSEPFPGFLPSTIGTYQAVFNADIAGDATLGNNVDTADLIISDSTLSVFNPNSSTGAYYLHRPSSHSAGEASFFQGMQFELSSGKSDTVTSASVVFPSSSQPGGNVSIQIYKRVGTGYAAVGGSVVMPLASSMISPSGSAQFAKFPMDNSNGPVVLDSGSYIAVVQIESIPAANAVTILTTEPLNDNAIDFAGYPGAQATSNNDGAFDFSPTSLAVGTKRAAVMRINFGPVASSVKNTITNFELGAARPNPAQSQFTVPVTLKAAAEVSVTLTNPMGQVVSTQNLGKVAAGQTAAAVFNTSALANGVYFYTVEAGGERTTNRVVVSH